MSKPVLILDDRGTQGFPPLVDPTLDEIEQAVKQVATNLGMDFKKADINACTKCGHFACVCDVMAQHEPDCKYRRAMCSSVAIECDEHDIDVCPGCDPCTCKVQP